MKRSRNPSNANIMGMKASAESPPGRFTTLTTTAWKARNPSRICRK